MLYIPEDFAHGFQTLQDDTEVFYQMAQRYSAETRAKAHAGTIQPLELNGLKASESSLNATGIIPTLFHENGRKDLKEQQLQTG